MPHGALERADVKGQTPLLIALRYGHDAAAHSLLQLGAKAAIATHLGLTASPCPYLHPLTLALTPTLALPLTQGERVRRHGLHTAGDGVCTRAQYGHTGARSRSNPHPVPVPGP